MISQTRLRDVKWVCTNSELGCAAVFPCFDAAGQVQHVLVVSREWGWLLAPPGGLTFGGTDVRFDGPLEKLYKLSAQAADRLKGLHHFDPWWLALSPGVGLERGLAEAVGRTNLAGAVFGGGAKSSGGAAGGPRLEVNEVLFDDRLGRVEQVEVGSSLWRRQVSGAALKEWLVSVAARAGASGPLSGRPAPRQAPGGADTPAGTGSGGLYVPTGGPLKLVAPERRAGGGRVTIGVTQPQQDRPLGAVPKPSPGASSQGSASGRPTVSSGSVEAAGKIDGWKFFDEPLKPPPLRGAPPPEQAGPDSVPPAVARTPGKPPAVIGARVEPPTGQPIRLGGPPDQQRPASSPAGRTEKPVAVEPVGPEASADAARPPSARPELRQVQQAIESIRRRLERGRRK